MATKGPPPIPTELKRRRGNPGQRRLPKPLTYIAPATAHIITVPEDGDDLIRTVLQGQARAWIGEADAIVARRLRDNWNERARLRALAEDLEPGWETHRYQPAVFVRLAQVEKEISECLSLLGLTPADRSRLGVAEVRAQSKLAALRERAGRTRAG